MNFLISKEVISRREISWLCSQFKRDVLKGHEKHSFLFQIKSDGPLDKLPGTICQNMLFIQYLPMMIIQKLKDNENILNHPVWRMFLKMRYFVQHILSNELSMKQIDDLKDVIGDYLDHRIAISIPPSERNDAPLLMDIMEELEDFTPVKNILPKVNSALPDNNYKNSQYDNVYNICLCPNNMSIYCFNALLIWSQICFTTCTITCLKHCTSSSVSQYFWKIINFLKSYNFSRKSESFWKFTIFL